MTQIQRAATVVALTLTVAVLSTVAQSAGKVWRIGFLGSASPSLGAPFVEAFRQGLREAGYVEGHNVTVEYRWAHGEVDALPGLAAEFVRLNVDAIFVGSTAAALAAMNLTNTIPIVFAGVADPVGVGLVPSLARPGGNITGLSTANIELVAKRLQLINEISSANVSRLGVVFKPADVSNVVAVRELEAPARALRMTLVTFEVRSPEDFKAAFTRMATERVNAVFVATGPLTINHAKRIVDLAATTRIPTVYGSRLFVENGGLMSYATDFREHYRRAGAYIDRIPSIGS